MSTSPTHLPPAGGGTSQNERGDHEPGRRDFLTRAIGILSATVAGFILYPVAKYLKQPQAAGGNVKSVVAATVEEMPAGSSKIFRFGNNTAILVNDQDGNLNAFDAVCTHLDCTVQYVTGEKHLLCACHNGKYDLNGQVISGPPPRPLEKYEVTLNGSDIIVSRA